MRTILIREIKLNFKSFLIWSISVGLMGLSCILLYQSMEGDMKDMADMFSNMGAFSDAFGMSTLSIATLKGYFATEVGTVHGLGSAMFAAILAIDILSKEEDKHTGEFLFSLPVSRTRVVMAKGICVAILLVLFTAICAVFYVAGFVYLKEELPAGEFTSFMLRQLLMNIEIAAICFGISAISGKSKMGMGLGIALVFYVYDLIGRVVPDLKDYLFVGPYSYANASEIFSGAETAAGAFITAAVVILCATSFAFVCYDRRDLAS
ncbi:ABC transporter permease subunit [Butyrivibrio sp. JL13D10]|uniref:ABC transporter permease subunit n=1 Tax=Butyrivibrio sp. JL13D10 TaxID=3236815 RepID=UPI0038B4FE20